MKTLSSSSLFTWLVLLFPAFVVAQETAAELESRLQGLFQASFDDLVEEATAMWIGIYDPLVDQDLFFVFGNASGPSPPMEPATMDQHWDIGSITKTFPLRLPIKLRR